MFEMDMNRCELCGDIFDNVFELVDHEMDGEEFDPSLILDAGISLRIGSMLRGIYLAAGRKDLRAIRTIVQSAYHVLYVAETNPDLIRDLIDEKLVSRIMVDFDDELRKILNEAQEDRG